MIYTVANSVELESAFLRAESGDRIELLGENYSGAILKGRTFETPVTITSADPDNPAVFRDQVTISHVEGIEITGIYFAPDSGALDVIDVVLVSRSSGVTLRDNSVTGHIPGLGEGLPAHQDVDTAEKARGLIEGQAFVRGIRVADSSDVVIADNTLTQLRKGIVLDTVERVDVQGNHLKDLRTDGINLVDAVSVTIAGNLMESFRPLHNYDNIAFADHGDFIQWWAGDGGLGIRDLVIRDNALLQNNGSWVQGIFGRGGNAGSDGSPDEFSGIRIENNLINTSHPNGIFVGDAANVLIAGNTLLPAPMDLTQPVITSGIPGIHVRTSAKRLPDGGYDFSRGGALPDQVSVQDNLLIGKLPFESYQINPELYARLGISESGNTVLSASGTEASYWGNAYPHLTSRAIAELSNLDSAIDVAGGVDVSVWPAGLRTMLSQPERQVSATQASVGQDVPTVHAQGLRIDGTAGPDEISGTEFGDVLRGGKGSDRITSGGGPDLIAFHRSDLEAGDVDVVIDLDFSAGDWLSFSGGFGKGYFDDAIDPNNRLTTFGSGDSAVVHDLADLEEVIALEAVSAHRHAANTVDLGFDLDGDRVPDWTLTLHGLSGVGETRAEISTEGPIAPGSPTVQVLRGSDATDDRIIGGSGDELLDGQRGGDEMHGGAGDDKYYVDDPSDLVIEHSGQGYDRVYTTVDYALPASIEALAGRGDNDLTLTGNSGNNWITSLSGNDVLMGGSGRDRLISRAGDDWLQGGADADVLQGGPGRDVFSFGRGDGADLVMDFEPGLDVLSLDYTPQGKRLSAVETTNGVLIYLENPGDRLFLSGMTETKLLSHAVFATSNDWVIEF